jgi:hypothetical protein
MPRKQTKLFGAAAIGAACVTALAFAISTTPKPVEANECPPFMWCTQAYGWVCNCGPDCWQLDKCNLVSGGDPFRPKCELIE